MTVTALEEKWAKDAAEKTPELTDAYSSDGKLRTESLSESVIDRIPRPTGWRIIILPYRGANKSKGGIVLADQTIERQQVSTTCGYVLSVGPLAYADTVKFPTGPWCKQGDFILVRPYAGSRLVIHGREFRIINDDSVEGVVSDPRGIKRK